MGLKTMSLKQLLVSLITITGLGAVAPALAEYPDKPIKIIHGFSSGGGSDIFLRTIIPEFSKNLGQKIIVDYRTGASGNIAMDTVAKAKPDGYTLLMGTPGLAINPSLYKSLTFDPMSDFAPISIIGSVPNVLVVHPDVPAKSVKELIAIAKASPGKLNYASPGAGSSLHLAAEQFKFATGINLFHIPYKGGAKAMAGVVSGRVQVMFNVLPSALPQIKAGTIRPLAVGSATRVDTLPKVPTIQEAGVPGFIAVTWNGILAPAGTPEKIVSKLNRALVAAMKSPALGKQLAKIGQEPKWSTPEAFRDFIAAETKKWQRVIPASGIKRR
jgi:tripartite-type tricarboxylate transporter receptor subunit TctC